MCSVFLFRFVHIYVSYAVREHWHFCYKSV